MNAITSKQYEIHELKTEILSFISHWYLALTLQANESADITRKDRQTDRRTDGQTHTQSTVTLAAHVHRELIIFVTHLFVTS